jgi:GR25 family glycosyltransferase involved in LPS biosynthesis
MQDTFIFDENNAYCISLDENSNRWTNMQTRFSKIGISVKRWQAARSRTEDIKDNYFGYLNDGQKGCAQSHINIWRDMLINPVVIERGYALILEDDACFDLEFKTKLNKFYEDVDDKEWDAIFLNASEPIDKTDKWVNVREQFLTGGYILSIKGATNVLNMFQHNYATSDWMTSRLQTLNHSYSYYPWLIIQEGKDSTIGSGFAADYNKVVQCLTQIEYSLDNYV